MFLEWIRQNVLILSRFISFRAFTWVSLLFNNNKKTSTFGPDIVSSTKFSTSKLQMKNYFVSTWLNQHLKETGNNTIFRLSPGGKKIAAHDKRVGCNTVTQGQLKILSLDSTRFLDSKMPWMTEKWLLQFNINLQEWSYKSLRKLTWPSFLLVSYTTNFCVLIRE